jgi:hypothetical protein
VGTIPKPLHKDAEREELHYANLCGAKISYPHVDGRCKSADFSDDLNFI